MNSKLNTAIQNLHGSFVNRLFTGDGAYAASLFASRPDCTLELPDDGICLHGPDEIGAYLRSGVWAGENTWVISHTPAIRENADGWSARGCWYATTFRLEHREEGPVMIQGSARFDADLVLEDGAWKYLRLQFYYLMTLEPNPYDSETTPGRSRTEPFSVEPGACADPRDFVLISRLMGRWAADRRAGGIDLFSAREDCALILPTLLDAPCVGRAAVEQGLARLAALEEHNAPYPLTIQMLTTPVISAEGDHAVGTWLALTHDCKGPAFGRDRQTACDVVTLGSLRVEFLREDGVWKLHRYELRPFLTLPRNDILESSFDDTLLAAGWIPAPASTPLREDADVDDILKIEEYVSFWVSGLRYRSEAPFYYSRLAIERPELLFYSTGIKKKRQGLEDVTREIFAMVSKFVTFQPKAPGNHIGTTPLIEFSPDRQTAEAIWLDYGWTTAAQVFGLTEPPYRANPAIARYHFKFIKLDGVWKVYYFHWAPFFRCGMWQFDYATTKGWSGTTSCRRFPLPLEEYVYEDDPSKRGEKIILEPSCVPCPYETVWTGALDELPPGK